MCGIVAAIAQRDVAQILIEGLKTLEYRGYDSAGLAVLSPEGVFHHIRRVGKVAALVEAVDQKTPTGGLGIAHTRWATHGQPSEENAHPHLSEDRIAVVHNGIIENHHDVRERLKQLGYQFRSDTDTEVIAHLIHHELNHAKDLLGAVQRALAQLQGAYAIGVIDKTEPNTLIVAREGSPLVIGLGIGENFAASDQLALLPVTRRFIFLEDGDVAKLTRDTVEIYDSAGNRVERVVHESELQFDMADKGPYRHYMLKEIYEQPRAIADTLEGRLTEHGVLPGILGPKADALLANVENVQIVACGTSYHAGYVAKYWIESLLGVPCQVEIASEYRYRDTVVPNNTLFVTISQSGETADTLAALKKAKKQKFLASLAICNVPGASLVRESDLVLMTRAGAEIGVASTKAFTTQLVALLLLVMSIGRAQHNDDWQPRLAKALLQLPRSVEAMLTLNDVLAQQAEHFMHKAHALFLGRGPLYPIAMEGALKLKEISYIHAEAYAAGELKHGPLALVDDDMPVVAIACRDHLVDKLLANLEEVSARGGRVYLYADGSIQPAARANVERVALPDVDELVAPIAYVVPLQLLSYHVAVLRGTDVDQPRNLAKSVTVE